MSESDRPADLDALGKPMRRLLWNADQLRVAGDVAGATRIYDRIVVETPEVLWDEEWYDVALGYSSGFLQAIAAHPRRRIYIAGCGRSGTWFTLGLMSTFQDVHAASDERHFGHFARIAARPEPVHIVKRRHDARRFLALLPESIAILFVLRDPRDVLTSRHLDTPNYINFERWAEETAALEALLAAQRPDLHVVRFEDLAIDPDAEQRRLAAELGLRIAHPASRFHKVFAPDARTQAIMHGLRRPDPSAIGRWRRSPDQVAFVNGILPRVEPHFARLAARFGYDLSR